MTNDWASSDWYSDWKVNYEKDCAEHKKFAEKLISYLLPLFIYDPFFSKLDYDELDIEEIYCFDRDPICLDCGSSEEVFSKRHKRNVYVDFSFYYGILDETTYFSFVGGENFEEKVYYNLNKSECRIEIRYYDASSESRLEAFSLLKTTSPDQAVKEFKEFLMKDITFLDDGDSGEEVPTPTLDPELVGVE